MVPRSQQRGGLQRLLQRGRESELNNTLDKIHQQRLTTNGCMLAATINKYEREDEMKNSKWRNQRTCQRLSGSMTRTLWDQFDKAGVGFPERIIGDERWS